MAASSRHPYVALLRAINVGGHGVVTMAELRARFEAFGCGDVATHIQSGNVLFTSKEADERRLERALEGKWKAAAGAATRILVRTPAELRRVAEENPFDPAARDGELRCHVLFLAAAPDAARAEALAAREAPGYRLHLAGRHLYFAYARALDGARRPIDFEKLLGVAGTARTWKVVAKLAELAARLPSA